ncbi:hypothetical protein BB558_003465 [Smittium angustum]|uniref:dihydrolipoyllysine-residue succinyltransferase n=1 Tax=Smittium angustum TaxID=133377 RepID=A0A2U1J613_SMIAN|nr:hypothetical protein BB558_003465 [Smittium angustum]
MSIKALSKIPSFLPKLSYHARAAYPIAQQLSSINFIQSRRYADSKLFTVKVPHLADSITEGTFKTWQKEIGEFVALDEEIGSIETDKVDIPINSPVQGVMKELLVANDENVVVGQNLCTIDTESSASASPTPAKPVETPVKAPEPTPVVKASPPPQEQPKAAAPPPPAQTPKAPAPTAPTPAQTTPAPETKQATGLRTERKVVMSRMRARIAERLKQSQNTSASLTTFNEIDMTNLMKLRSKYKDTILEKHGVKFGFMSTFVAACAKGVARIPEVNARVDGDSIVYSDFFDVSVAVATPKGLVTPIVRNAEQMSLVEIEREIAKLGAKARDNKLTLEELSGGTFTISNGGIFGSLLGTPIINMPQSAILGMHSIKNRPVAVGDKVEIRPMMYVALSYDHRIIDGREASTFLVTIKDIIENPERLLLDI